MQHETRRQGQAAHCKSQRYSLMKLTQPGQPMQEQRTPCALPSPADQSGDDHGLRLRNRWSLSIGHDLVQASRWALAAGACMHACMVVEWDSPYAKAWASKGRRGTPDMHQVKEELIQCSEASILERGRPRAMRTGTGGLMRSNDPH